VDSLVKRHGADRLAVIRAARPGDIFVMLALDTNEIPLSLTRHLHTLQELVSGHPPEIIHVTLQRFGSGNSISGKKLLERLETMKSSLISFDVTADGFLPVYLESRNSHLLKWTVPGSEPLRSWYRLVDTVGHEIGLKPLYLRQGYGAWVTALLEIDPSNSAALAQIPIPKPLFRVCRLMVSRLLENGQFESVGEFLF
jgi:hypothetical protein